MASIHCNKCFVITYSNEMVQLKLVLEFRKYSCNVN